MMVLKVFLVSLFIFGSAMPTHSLEVDRLTRLEAQVKLLEAKLAKYEVPGSEQIVKEASVTEEHSCCQSAFDAQDALYKCMQGKG